MSMRTDHKVWKLKPVRCDLTRSRKAKLIAKERKVRQYYEVLAQGYEAHYLVDHNGFEAVAAWCESQRYYIEQTY